MNNYTNNPNSQATTANVNNMTLDKLSIISINVNSIVKNERRYNLTHFIDQHNPDIVLLNETKLNYRHAFTFADYNFFRNDRTDSVNGGGTGIIIKNNFKYKVIRLKNHNKLNTLEYSILKFVIGSMNLFIISAYAAGHNRANFVQDLDIIFDELNLDDDNNFYVLAGDLKGQHPDWAEPTSVINPRGTYLRNWVADKAIQYRLNVVGPGSPTFKLHQSYLDIGLVDSRIVIDNLSEGKLGVIPYDSDHDAIRLVCLPFERERFIIEALNGSQERRQFNKTDWDKLYSILSTDSIKIPRDRNLTNGEIDTYLDKLEEKILDAILMLTPTSSSCVSTKKYLNKKIERLQKKKSKVLTQLFKAKRNRLNDLANRLKNEQTFIKQSIKTEFRQTVSNYWKKEIESIKVKDHLNFFPKINRIFRRKGKMELSNLKIPNDGAAVLENAGLDRAGLHKVDNQFLIDDPQNKVDVMRAAFAAIYNDNPLLNENGRLHELINTTDRFIDEMHTRSQASTRVTTFSPENPANNPNIDGVNKDYFLRNDLLEEILLKLNTKKAAGHDRIPNFVIRSLPAGTAEELTVLFNNILNNHYFPDRWKLAKVIPIPKKNKDPSKPNSYRPISFLPNLRKIFEIVINKQLTNFCESNKIIPKLTPSSGSDSNIAQHMQFIS